MIENDPKINVNRKLWDDWEAYSAGNHLFYVQEDVPEAFLRDAYKRAVRSFYLHPSFIFRAVLKLRTLSQFISYFKYFLNMLSIKIVSDQQKFLDEERSC